MTDRQISESTIGLAGRLSHIPFGVGKAEDCGWQSTRDLAPSTPVLKELGPSNTWRLGTATIGAQAPGSSTSRAWRTSQKQQRWLLKAYPEARLGNELLHDQLTSHSPSQFEGAEPWSSSLLAIGEVTDTSEPQRVTGAPLVAIATGEANNVLRLAKPTVEEWQWGDDDSVSLRIPDMTEKAESITLEEEIAGPIRRLKTVVDSKRYDPTRWVVVQRDSGTRVFQPEYRRVPTICNYNSGGTPSRIVANPLFYIPKDQTGGNRHTDAAFNPGVRSKPPQLGLIDDHGYWSVWDIAHTRIKSSGNPKVTLRKCGHIEKGILNRLPLTDNQEGQWHKILWVGCPGSSPQESQAFDFEEDLDMSGRLSPFPQLVRSSTLLLCNTELVRLLDLTNNSFLPDLPFVGQRGRDFILDVLENPRDSQYVFVLTTSKLFVVRVSETPGQSWGETQKQWSIVLAISHLRDGFDRTLKLSVSPGATSSGKAVSLLCVYSNGNAQVDLYRITMSKSDPSRVSFHREAVVSGAFQSLGTMLQTVCLQPLSAISKRSTMLSEFAGGLAKEQVRFYQLSALRVDMCFISTLCVSTSTLPIDQIQRPDYKISRARHPSRERKRILRRIATRFVVPDEIAAQISEDTHSQAITRSPPDWPVIQRHFRILYEHFSTIFRHQVKQYYASSSREESFASNPFDHVHIAVEQGIENGNMPATTLFQMIANLTLPHDVERTAIEWVREIGRLEHVNPSVELLTLNRPHNQITRPTNSLQQLYSALHGMTTTANLGNQREGWSQEARPTAIRQMACDVYLSLFGLVYRQVEPTESLARDLDNMVIDSQQGSRAGSVPMSEVSLSSSRGSKTEPSQGEDPAMALLRSYTGTGKFVPAKPTTLLDKWEIGANLDDYAFDLDRNKEVTPGMQRRAKQLARESRKRRRAETLLRMHKEKEPSLPATQPAPNTRFFNQSSQPSGAYSQSQAIMSDPLQTMSQPISGPFGRREERPKKKVKRRKGGF